MATYLWQLQHPGGHLIAICDVPSLLPINKVNWVKVDLLNDSKIHLTTTVICLTNTEKPGTTHLKLLYLAMKCFTPNCVRNSRSICTCPSTTLPVSAVILQG